MTDIVISATGLFTPAHAITNEELVASFNEYVRREQVKGNNSLQPSSTDFIVKASGIRQRYVVEKENILDPDVMGPRLPERPDSELSILAEMGVAAARDALSRAGRDPADIDGVMCACSNLQRAYPAIAIEIQEALGIEGFAFDMNVACSSATFGIQAAADMIRAGNARAILVINPEICSGHLNWRDRDSHFIFGDVATAVLVEDAGKATSKVQWKILGTRLLTKFSNNIRNNFGFLNRTAPETVNAPDKLFVQEGRKVFKEVVPMVAGMILSHLASLGLATGSLKRLWLHQANINMNDFIARKVLGRDPAPGEAPNILDEYANTSSAGSVIAFHKHHDGMAPGELGLLCSFGAGYSAGSVVLQRV